MTPDGNGVSQGPKSGDVCWMISGSAGDGYVLAHLVYEESHFRALGFPALLDMIWSAVYGIVDFRFRRANFIAITFWFSTVDQR